MDALNFGYNNVIQEQLQANSNNSNNPNIVAPFGSRITTEDVIFVSIMLVVVLIIVFAQRPIVGPAIDSMAYDLTHNAVTDFVMSSVSSSYVLSKRDAELRDAVRQIRKPVDTSNKIIMLRKHISSDIRQILESTHDNIYETGLDKLQSVDPDLTMSIIAYSIASRLQRSFKSNTDPLNLQTLNAPFFLHAASSIVSCSDSDSDSVTVMQSDALLSLQLITISMNLIRGIDSYSKRDLINDIVKHRLGNGRSEPNEQNALNMDLEFRTMHDIIKNVLDDTQRAIDGVCIVSCTDMHKPNDTKSAKIIHIEQNRLVAEFMLVYESAWLVGGAPITESVITHLRSAANDFGVLYQIYMSFVSYYADMLKCKPNYVSVVGVKKSYTEFYNRVSLFVQKATELSIMTDALKHIINYLSDCVTLSKSIISNAKNTKPKKRVADEKDDENNDENMTKDAELDETDSKESDESDGTSSAD